MDGVEVVAFVVSCIFSLIIIILAASLVSFFVLSSGFFNVDTLSYSMKVIDETSGVNENANIRFISSKSLDSNIVDKLIASGNASTKIKLDGEYELNSMPPIEDRFYIEKNQTYYKINSTASIESKKESGSRAVIWFMGMLIGSLIVFTMAPLTYKINTILLKVVLERVCNLRKKIRFEY